MKLFDEKVALVTGASSGIGRAAAVAFAREGANVIVIARRENEGQETVELIRKAGSDGLFIQADVAKTTDIEAMFEKTISTYGRLDYAFNNAGVEGALVPLAEQTEADFDRVISINLKSVWLCMKYQIQHMLEHGGGAIVNNASIYGQVALPALPIYTASKHGVIGLTKAAALAYAKQNIRVNAVCPGDIETPMAHRDIGTDEKVKQYGEATVTGHWGKPEDIGEAVVWLCSDKAAFVIGQSLFVDGGYTIR